MTQKHIRNANEIWYDRGRTEERNFERKKIVIYNL
jgi:hypothetical protein